MKDISDPKKYPGIRIFEATFITGGVTIPELAIFVDDRNDVALVQHEYGHYLNYKYWEIYYGKFNASVVFHSFISVPSVVNMGYDHFFKTRHHGMFYTEIIADQFSKINFGKDYEGKYDKRFSTYDGSKKTGK